MSIPQYSKSTDPDVVRAVEANRIGRVDLAKKAHEWAKERGSETVYFSGWGFDTYVTGLPGHPQGFGKWTCRKGVWRPFKNNKAEHETMTALNFSGETIPGLPKTVQSRRNADWSSYWMTPRPFVEGGVAWLGFGHLPGDEQFEASELGQQWVEVLASEFYAADERLRGVSA